jgi:hypothetical protein
LCIPKHFPSGIRADFLRIALTVFRIATSSNGAAMWPPIPKTNQIPGLFRRLSGFEDKGGLRDVLTFFQLLPIS